MAALIAAISCAHADQAVTQTVAIFPVGTLGVPREQGEALGAALAQEIERTGTARPVPAERLAEALAEEKDDQQACRESGACLARTGRRASSDSVLALTVAGLGDLWLVRGRLVRSADGLGLQDLQETVEGGASAVDRHAPQLARRLFPDTTRRPWYRQWWVWTSIAAGIGAGAGVTWAVLRGRENPDGAVIIGSL